MNGSRSILFLALLGFACEGALAHHAFLTHYDPSQSMEIQGTVADFNLRSPHSSFSVDVTGEDGKTQRWEVEAGALPHLRRMGIDKNTFEPGDPITVIAWPNRRPDNPLVFGIGYIAGDGTAFGKLPDLGADTSQRSGVGGIAAVAGRWSTPFPERTTESPLPLTPAGRSAWEGYDPRRSPANTCEPSSFPSKLYSPFLNDIQFDDQEVVFYHEGYGIRRTVPLHSEPRLAEPTGVLGIVSGRIEGDELVIESSDYPASAWGLAIAVHTNGGGADIPSSTQKKVIERYSASDDGQTLSIEYTVEDPVYLSKPYTARVNWNRVADDEPMYDFDCEVESAERFSRDP